MGGSSSAIFDEVKKAKDDSDVTIEKIRTLIKNRRGANMEYSGKVQEVHSFIMSLCYYVCH